MWKIDKKITLIYSLSKDFLFHCSDFGFNIFYFEYENRDFIETVNVE